MPPHGPWAAVGRVEPAALPVIIAPLRLPLSVHVVGAALLQAKVEDLLHDEGIL